MARSIEEEVFRWYVRRKLIGLREARNLKHHHLARALHIDRSTYSYYELGKTIPDLYTLYRIALYYEVPVSVFFPDPAHKTLDIREI